jgi:hypothetical protein
VPAEPEPCRAARVIAVDSPVAVSGGGGNDVKPASVLLVRLVRRPCAALVDDFNPRIVTGVERRPDCLALLRAGILHVAVCAKMGA